MADARESLHADEGLGPERDRLGPLERRGTMPRRRPRQDYPYHIPQFTPQENDDLTLCESAAVSEFVRIELLLRSKTFMELYRAQPKYVYEFRTNRRGKHFVRKMPNQPSGDPVLQGSGQFPGGQGRTQYNVQYGWDVLNSAHHHLLRTGSSPYCDAVVDLQALVKGKPSRVPFEDYLLLEAPDYICLRFKVTVPFDHLKNALKAYYDARRRNKADSLTLAMEQEKKKKGPVFKAKTWLDYLRWYDQVSQDRKTVGQIAKMETKDFPDKERRKSKQIEKGIFQVSRLIPLAEKNQWPPPSKYLH
jgi:hypothetical protein